MTLEGPSAGISKSTATLSFLVVVLALATSAAHGRSPSAPDRPDRTASAQAADQPFLREYALGVQRIPLDGGKIYGWKLNDRVTFGRFKGENDEFGFSVELDPRQRVEITTEGVRWRRAIGAGSH
jgi:hypothetical protein